MLLNAFLVCVLASFEPTSLKSCITRQMKYQILLCRVQYLSALNVVNKID